LLGPGAYSSSNTKIDYAIFGIDRKTPLELFEAWSSSVSAILAARPEIGARYSNESFF
jgi:hypothetical protein